jgi:rare lipoprotein A (peptidoglycan hydrolase)
MRKLMILGLLVAVLLPLGAQHLQEGVAMRYETDETGLYASHETLPFGTLLVVTNTSNNKKVSVQVGGRLASRTIVLELSPEAAAAIGIGLLEMTVVRIEEVPREVKVRVARPRIGALRQTGHALVMSGGGNMTASHPSLPIGTKIKTVNTSSNKSATLTVTGRIRASSSRVIEISPSAAAALGIKDRGEVSIETVDR